MEEWVSILSLNESLRKTVQTLVTTFSECRTQRAIHPYDNLGAEICAFEADNPPAEGWIGQAHRCNSGKIICLASVSEGIKASGPSSSYSEHTRQSKMATTQTSPSIPAENIRLHMLLTRAIHQLQFNIQPGGIPLDNRCGAPLPSDNDPFP
jgi:hypothetical protein